MYKLLDFVKWVNALTNVPVYDLKKFGEVLLSFCEETLGFRQMALLGKDGIYDGLHLITTIGEPNAFSDLDWDLIESLKIDATLASDSMGTLCYLKLVELEHVRIVAVCNKKDNLSGQTIELLRCATRLVYDRYRNTQLKKMLLRSERTFELTFEQVGSGRCVTDLEGYILETNQKFCDIIGYSQEEAIGLRVKHLTHPDDWQVDVVYKERLILGEIPYFSMEKRYFRKDGSLIWVYTTVALMRGEDGEADYLIGIVQDISAQKSADIEVLTGLYNRRYMMNKLEEVYNRTQRSGETFSVIISDIDHFKTINDDYGHDCGDEVLKGLSKLLVSAIRTVDVLSRWGGEEFLMLLPNTDSIAARQLAERIRIMVSKASFEYEGQLFRLTMTFGIASYEDNLSIKDIIRRADQALYKGKALGRNKVF